MMEVALQPEQGYAIVRVNGVDAHPHVSALWRRNREASPHVDALFRWYYEQNTGGQTHCFLVLHRVGEHEEVVGMAGLAARTLHVRRGETLSAALLGDFLIDKRHRTLLPAMKLQREIYAWGRTHFDLLYGFPNPAAQPVMKRLGYRVIGRMARYVLVLRHARYLQQRIAGEIHRAPHWLRSVLESRIASRVLAAPVDLWRRFGQPGLSRPLASEMELRLCAPGAAIDALFANSNISARIASERSSAFLRWRFLDRPDQHGQLWTLFLRDEALAYAFVHRDGLHAHVRDVYGVDEDAIAQLMVALGGKLRAQGVSALSLLLAAPEALHARLHDVGFRMRGEGHPLIGLPGDSGRFVDGGGWYLTEADEDQ